MMWIAYAVMWVSMAAVVCFAIQAIGNAWPLIFMIVPALVKLEVRSDRSNGDNSEGNDDETDDYLDK